MFHMDTMNYMKKARTKYCVAKISSHLSSINVCIIGQNVVNHRPKHVRACLIGWQHGCTHVYVCLNKPPSAMEDTIDQGTNNID